MSRRESVTKAKLRTRRDSGTKLDHYYKIVNKTILSHQVSIRKSFCSFKIQFRTVKNASLIFLITKECCNGPASRVK